MKFTLGNTSELVVHKGVIKATAYYIGILAYNDKVYMLPPKGSWLDILIDAQHMCGETKFRRVQPEKVEHSSNWD